MVKEVFLLERWCPFKPFGMVKEVFLLNLLFTIFGNQLLFVMGSGNSDQNQILCSIASEIPALTLHYGWSCPTSNVCAWKSKETMKCTDGIVTEINIYDLGPVGNATIPTQIGLLKNLTSFGLYDVQVGGTIPTQIGLLQYMTSIYIYDTELSGTIPTQISQLINLESLIITQSELCGCPPLPQPLDYCDLTDSYKPCDSDLQCDNTYNCLIGCNGDYQSQFSCQNGVWVSNTDLELNGTNLLQSTFTVKSLDIFGNVLISQSTLHLQGNLVVQNQSQLIIENSIFTVNGSLHLNPLSTIIIQNTNNISLQINQCAFLDGSLIVDGRQSQAGTSLPILTSNCTNGKFSSVYFNLTDSECVVPHLETATSSISLYFELGNKCSALPTWIYIVVGIVSFFLLLGIIGAVYVSIRKFMARDQKIGEMISRSTMEK